MTIRSRQIHLVIIFLAWILTGFFGLLNVPVDLSLHGFVPMAIALIGLYVLQGILATRPLRAGSGFRIRVLFYVLCFLLVLATTPCLCALGTVKSVIFLVVGGLILMRLLLRPRPPMEDGSAQQGAGADADKPRPSTATLGTMRIKMEVAGLIAGILALGLDVFEVILWYHFDYTPRFFSGGNLGGVIIVIGIIAGPCALILQLFNLASGRSALWGARIALDLVFLCLMAVVGALH